MRTSIEQIYDRLLSAWNDRDAAAFAELFAVDGNVVGFDGSQMNGRQGVEEELTSIFSSHETSRYVYKVREVRELSPTVALLRAVAGMVPPHETVIKPDVNAIQTIVASRDSDGWHIELFQNTPAQFHGRPDLSAALTEELNDAARGD